MNNKRVGVVVGRFQTPYLHKGHMDLVNHALDKNEHVLILLGVAAMEGTRRHPIEFSGRAAMIKTDSNLRASRITVRPIKDNPSDLLWSQDLDRIVKDLFPKSKVTLYGSRDSFIPHYHGNFKVVRYRPVTAASATELRRRVVESPSWFSPDFRAGVVYAAEKRWPQLYQCVDIAVFDRRDEGVFLLLGRKHKNDGWCFPGGFVDPTDGGLEMAARRELQEETHFNLEAADFAYEGSMLVDDWRYPGPDRIMTSLFSASRVFGSAGFAKAGDDLHEVRWFDVTKKTGERGCRSLIKKHHRPLFDMLSNRILKARFAFACDNYRPDKETITI